MQNSPVAFLFLFLLLLEYHLYIFIIGKFNHVSSISKDFSLSPGSHYAFTTKSVTFTTYFNEIKILAFVRQN